MTKLVELLKRAGEDPLQREYSDAVALQNAVQGWCRRFVRDRLRLPQPGPTTAGAARARGESVVFGDTKGNLKPLPDDEEINIPDMLPMVLGIVRAAVSAPPSANVKKAAEAFLDAVLQNSHVDWSRASVVVVVDQRGGPAGVLYQLERTRGKQPRRPSEVTVHEPNSAAQELVYRLLVEGTLCRLEHCRGPRNQRCSVTGNGCKLKPSDKTLAALSLLVASPARFREAIAKGQGEATPRAVIDREISLVKDARRKVMGMPKKRGRPTKSKA